MAEQDKMGEHVPDPNYLAVKIPACEGPMVRITSKDGTVLIEAVGKEDHVFVRIHNRIKELI